MKQFLRFSFVILSVLIFSQCLTAQSSNKNLFQSLHKNEFSLIVELGTLNTNVFTSADLFEPEVKLRDKKQFVNDEENWSNENGFTASIKMAKTVNNNLFDSNVSLDFISGFSYVEYKLTQNNYTPHSSDFFGCFEIYYLRELKVKSIAIPLEIRSNIEIGKFNFSPTVGFGINIPVNKSHDLFHYNYIDNQLIKGESFMSEKLQVNEKFPWHQHYK